MSGFTSADISRLTDLLQKELELFRKIRKLTEKQTELLSEDDITPFEKSLDERQKLIEKINGLHQESEPLMQSYITLSESGKNNEIEIHKEEIRKIVEFCAEKNSKNLERIKEKSS